MMAVVIVTTLLLSALCISSSAGQGSDQTIRPGASGEDVVEAVVARIHQAGIFGDDRSFLRRIAYVESKDGNDRGTYRTGYNGGIWQVDQIAFLATKDSLSHPSLAQKHEKIREKFNIDWSSVTWNDLRKPLYSGLAARLFLSNIPQEIPFASEISLQANYWKLYYNKNGAGTVQKFIDDVTALLKNKECRTGIDLIFVLDSSGSIGQSNFQLMRNFVANVVRNLDIGPDESRVGVIVYSYSAQVQFSLNTHTTNASLLQAIANIPFINRGTNTADAILTCIQQFNTTYGARPKSSGIPRIAIVVTDGRSDDPDSTIAAAQKAHSEGILSYAVGIGSSVYTIELAAIASDPDSQYVRLLNQFSTLELRSLQETLNNEACTAPAVSKVGQAITNTLEQDEVTFIQLTLPDDGLTIRIDVTTGVIVSYGSNKIQNPNEAFYDFKLSNSRREIFVTTDTFGSAKINNFTNITIYISIQGQSVSNQFTLNTTIGDTTTDAPGSNALVYIFVAVLVGVMAIAIAIAALVIRCNRARKTGMQFV